MKQSKRFDFYCWRTTNFNPHLEFDKGRYNTCGAAAVSCITGVPPRRVEARFLPKSQEHFSTRAIRRAFYRLGWETKAFDCYGLSNQKDDSDWRRKPFYEDNIFLIAAWTTHSDQSWFVSYKNQIFHNGEYWSVQGSDFALCHPVTDILAVRKRP